MISGLVMQQVAWLCPAMVGTISDVFIFRWIQVEFMGCIFNTKSKARKIFKIKLAI